MFEVDGNNNIYITRGDTGIFTISLIDGDGNPYVPEPEDTIRFGRWLSIVSRRLVTVKE